MDINVLGPVEVRVEDRVLDIGSRRHRQVLAALLVDAGAVVGVDTLVERVWGESGALVGSVQAIVSRLRSRLGESVIVTRSPGYRVDLSGLRLDAEAFTRRLAEAREESDAARARAVVAGALSLWRGSAYADIGLPFAEAEAQRLERLRLSALELLAELDLRLGRHGDVLAWLPDLVAQHPLQESLRSLLMLALYRAGRQAEALAAFEDARRVLAEELGIDPTPELRRLHERVLRQDRSLALPPASAGVAERPRRTELIGRDEQLAEIDAAVARGLAGEPVVVGVSGEAGIGKTRLVEEAAARASGAAVGFGRCLDHDGAPAFWPWEQALSDLVAAVGPEQARATAAGRAEPVALLVPALGPAPTVAGTATVARARLYDAVAAFLETLSVRRPVLLVLEDFHWADDESVELLEYVATTVRSGRLVLVVTVRDPSELAATAGDRVVAALARRPGAVRLELTGLTVPQVRELVAKRTGVEVSLEVARGLRERTEGNPFYVSELALLYGEERRRSGAAGIPVPTSVRAVIERRLRHMPAEDLEALVAAAVVGRSFDLPLLAEVTGRSRLELAEVLDRGVAAGILDEQGVGLEQRFTHALVQETLVLSVGPLRRASLHGDIARALDARHGADGAHAAAIAHHYAEAGPVGDVARGVELSIAAAASAAARFALGEAERNLRQALALVAAAPVPEGKLLELDLRVRLGSLLTLRYGYNGAGVAEERRRALALAADTGSTGHLLSALWGTWGNELAPAGSTRPSRSSARSRRPWITPGTPTCGWRCTSRAARRPGTGVTSTPHGPTSIGRWCSQRSRLTPSTSTYGSSTPACRRGVGSRWCSSCSVRPRSPTRWRPGPRSWWRRSGTRSARRTPTSSRACGRSGSSGPRRRSSSATAGSATPSARASRRPAPSRCSPRGGRAAGSASSRRPSSSSRRRWRSSARSPRDTCSVT